MEKNMENVKLTSQSSGMCKLKFHKQAYEISLAGWLMSYSLETKKEIAEMTEQHDVIWNNELAYYFKKGLIPAKSELYIA